MAGQSEPSHEPFQVEFGGKTYQCERVVRETRGTLTQRIVVSGIGSKDDTASYGRTGHRVESMHATARLIAVEIIGDDR